MGSLRFEGNQDIKSLRKKEAKEFRHCAAYLFIHIERVRYRLPRPPYGCTRNISLLRLIKDLKEYVLSWISILFNKSQISTVKCIWLHLATLSINSVFLYRLLDKDILDGDSCDFFIASHRLHKTQCVVGWNAVGVSLLSNQMKDWHLECKHTTMGHSRPNNDNNEGRYCLILGG